MTYKNRFLVLVLCTFIGSVSASEAIEEDSFEVVSASEMEELEELLKTIDSDEFLEAFQIAVDAMVEKAKIAGDAMVEKAKIAEDAMIEKAKIAGNAMVESSKVTAAAITKASKEFGVEAAREWANKIKSASRPWELMLWALVSLYAAKTITSILNY